MGGVGGGNQEGEIGQVIGAGLATGLAGEEEGGGVFFLGGHEGGEDVRAVAGGGESDEINGPDTISVSAKSGEVLITGGYGLNSLEAPIGPSKTPTRIP